MNYGTTKMDFIENFMKIQKKVFWSWPLKLLVNFVKLDKRFDLMSCWLKCFLKRIIKTMMSWAAFGHVDWNMTNKSKDKLLRSSIQNLEKKSKIFVH